MMLYAHTADRIQEICSTPDARTIRLRFNEMETRSVQLKVAMWAELQHRDGRFDRLADDDVINTFRRRVAEYCRVEWEQRLD